MIFYIIIINYKNNIIRPTGLFGGFFCTSIFHCILYIHMYIYDFMSGQYMQQEYIITPL